MSVIAIDPGVDSFAVYHDALASPVSGNRWHFYSAGRIEIGNSERVDAAGIYNFILRLQPERVFIELVGPMGSFARGRKQGLGSTSKFVRAAGYCEAAVLCSGIPLTLIVPQRWKKHYDLPTGATKEDSRLKAIELFPELGPHLRLKKSHNLAEAALLASYGAWLMRPF